MGAQVVGRAVQASKNRRTQKPAPPGRIVVPVTKAVEARAHRQAVASEITEIAAFLQEALGQKLTAFIAGAKDSKTVGRWAHGGNAPRSEAQTRLRGAYQVFHLIQECDSEEVARAWFIGMNPHLDDRSPAEALSEDRLRQVMSAARLFTESD